ncbi:C39 family peptidase [Melioribacteraceae bacterium 4301-Me]|uniref:C39 family peptidase n=1 Tax=Pyranulibacter aquaticus TaxID=3163344 RepID=UPI003596E8E2
MKIHHFVLKFLLIIVSCTTIISGQTYPDQHFFYEKEKLVQQIESLNGTTISGDGKKIILSEEATTGTVIFKPDSSQFPFNRGLPSWNGHAPNDSSSFKVMMRFYKNGWSSWLTVGFWKANIWSSYGPTSYNGNEINVEIDYVILKSYYTKWQFKVEMKRTSISQPSPELYKLSFFVSDQKTTDNVNITSIINDKPEAIFIDTKHIYQYSVDPEIGGEICSPTSVAMVLRSYNIDVDPLQFARDTKCPYWGIFGIWPRVVQNAAEYGLNGAVTRYRSWSQAREVLASGGRVVMSVGSPLYPNGHLIMLAGFDTNGNPISHDPAKSNGYKYVHNKTDLSKSWFNKGGIAYTFFLENITDVNSVETIASPQPEEFKLLQNYPNPFNAVTIIGYQLKANSHVTLKVYDILGRELATLVNEDKPAGKYEVSFDASKLAAGVYIYCIYVQSIDSKTTGVMNKKMIYLK